MLSPNFALLFYAGNIVGLGCAVKHFAETIRGMTTVTSQVSLTINVLKTKKKNQSKLHTKTGHEGTERLEVGLWLYSTFTIGL
jgi:hypothetical protein